MSKEDDSARDAENRPAMGNSLRGTCTPRPAAASLSLYQSEDMPRVRRLQRLSASLRRLELAVADARHSPVFEGMRPLHHEPDSPVFLNQGPYRQIRSTYFAMRSAADRLVRFGVEERVKDTSKMYEHWVLVQLAFAIRLAGLTCADVNSLLVRSRNMRSLRIDRRTRLVFDAKDGRRLVLRYEPWISSANEARGRGRGETLYRADNRATSLCPDIVLEVHDATDLGSATRVSYAVVLDSKYKTRIRDEDLDGVIGKYTTLRACHDDSQVVKQVWVVAPLGREGVFPRESSVQWGPNGPSRPRTESVHGTIGAIPPEHLANDPHELVKDWIAPPIQLFAGALLRYLNLVD